MERQIVLGVDIGGSHITVALIDTEKRALIANSLHREAIDSQSSAEILLAAWCSIIRKSYTGYETLPKWIGIAMPGPFDYENGICLIKDQDKFKALYRINIKDELAKRLQIPPSQISFINDAAGFLQGEVFAGSAKHVANVIGFTLGTGLGSAICLNGQAIDAALWNAPFLDGIAEDYLSSRWFIKRYLQLGGNNIDGVKDLAVLTHTDSRAKQVFEEFGNNFAAFLVPLILRYRSEMVIIGGNIAQAFDEFSANLIAVLASHQLTTEIKITKLKENAALIGAASSFQITQTNP